MHSLEVRAPFLDIELVDFVRTIPHTFKLRRGVTKYLLKKALEPLLPPDILHQAKQGFAMPLADPSALAAWHLCRLTRQHVTVALNGDGGDEMFAGYQRSWLDPLADVYARLPRLVTGHLVPWLAARLPARGDVPVEADWRAGLARLDQAARIPRAASLVRWGSYFSPWAREALLRPEFARAAAPADTVALYEAVYDAAQAASKLDRGLAADAAIYLPGDLLVKADRMAMAHGLEGRSPFLDHHLAQWAARLPEHLKLRGTTGKYLLRKAFADMSWAGVTLRQPVPNSSST